MTKRRGPERQRTIFERQWPWLLATLFVSLFTCGLAGVVGFGVFENLSALFRPVLRGYSVLGVTLGVVTVLAFLLVLFYSLRKRLLQEELLIGRGTMVAWLWLHVYVGLLALLFALLHAGYGAISLQLSTGKLLLFAFALLVLSGVAWRLVYSVVPPIASRDVGNYSEAASAHKAARLLIEIEKLSAGQSPRFQDLMRWVLAERPARPAIEQAIATLDDTERGGFQELADLAAMRARAIDQAGRQSRYVALLQGWRFVHIPLVLVCLVLLPIHVVMAYDVPARLAPPGAGLATTLGGFEPAEACESCHAQIVVQWRRSMHARAMTSPVMIAQSNQVAAVSLHGQKSPDPAKICVNCHGPLGAALADQATLPLKGGALSDTALLNDGVDCAVCHQWSGSTKSGGAGLSAYADGFQPGRTYFGPFADAVPNAHHKSEQSAAFAKPGELCKGCHSVQYDKNGDGRFVKGTDLVLQTLWDEWSAYAKTGGVSCIDCHMPDVSGNRAAESALVPFEQDRQAPPRKLHDHSFVGPDSPLDVAPEHDALRGARQQLLERAATIAIGEPRVDKSELAFDVSVTSAGTGHYLPGGFAFVRQLWLEVTLRDASGRVVAGSGVLGSESDDLCDATTLDESDPMRQFVRGCKEADLLLVNFQQQLVDAIEVARDARGSPLVDERGEFKLARAARGRETALQFLDGGPVPRIRPFDKKPVSALAPGESRTFAYRLPLGGGSAQSLKVSVRLRFRALPPYFVRALGRAQPQNERPRLEPLVSNVKPYDVAKAERLVR